MAKTINLGKVGLTFEGDYDSSKNYASRTCVFYNHVSWASKKDVPAGIAPGTSEEYWQKVSERGAQGIQGERGPQGNSAFDGTGIELVNNLTQGGEASALSAEQGKILKTELTELESLINKGYMIHGVITNTNIEFTPSVDKGIWIAGVAGTYTNLLDGEGNPVVVEKGYITFLAYNNGVWSTLRAVCEDVYVRDLVNKLSASVGGFTLKGTLTDINTTFAPTAKGMWLTTTAGTYANLLDKNGNAIVVEPNTIAFLCYDNVWSVVQIKINIRDTEMKKDSPNFISSGAVYNDVQPIKEAVAESDFQIISGQYFSTQYNSIRELSSLCRTQKIIVSEGDVVQYSGNAGASAYGIVVFNKSNEVIATFFEGGDNDIKKQIAIMPQNSAYVICNSRDESSSKYTIPLQVTRYVSPLIKSGIIVSKVSDTEFDVKSLDEKSNQYVTHRFKYEYYEDLRDGKTIVGSDVYYIRDTIVNGAIVAQGNTNFIFKVDKSQAGFEREGSHVGAGHGCCIQIYSKFFADGVEINPLSLTEDIACDDFRFVTKVNHLAVDTYVENFASDHATPKLDSDGNTILTAVHFLDLRIEKGNRLKHYNRLVIKRDNLRFAQCHGGMLTGMYASFSETIINNEDSSWIKEQLSNNTLVVTPQAGSVDLQENPYQFADTAIMFGKGITIKQSVIPRRDVRRENSNIYLWFNYPSSNIRGLKVYFEPCVCTEYATALGREAEVFNAGDVIEVDVVREISL